MKPCHVGGGEGEKSGMIMMLIQGVVLDISQYASDCTKEGRIIGDCTKLFISRS
jgi:hypothetical protein